MITVLENALTQKKHTLNLVDHRGRVIGFNPYPHDKKLKYGLRNSQGRLLITEDVCPIEQYLIGSPFHFGNDVSFIPSDLDDSLSAMNIDLVSDKFGFVNELHVEGVGGEYYVEDIGISKDDLNNLFSEKNIERWKNQKTWASHLFKTEKSWDELTDSERIERLLKRVESLERKVHILGNAK